MFQTGIQIVYSQPGWPLLTIANVETGKLDIEQYKFTEENESVAGKPLVRPRSKVR